MDYRHILAATDFSALGDLSLRRAAELAVAADAKLTVVHVLPEPESPSPLFAHYDVSTNAGRREAAKERAHAALVERVPDAVRESGIDIDVVVRIGDPTNELLALDAKLAPDLIVLATHGRRGWQRFVMGSVAERVVQMAKADVLAVRAELEPADDAGTE